MSAGRPTRLELYGCMLAVVVTLSAMFDRQTRSERERDTIDIEILKKIDAPIVVKQDNNQVVIVESDRMKDIRARARKLGWKDDEPTKSNLPATDDAVSSSAKRETPP